MEPPDSNSDYRCGFVTIVGRPNVGKSTLLNNLIGQKISITTRKPQTTRYHLLGIKANPESQIIFIDTPGIQQSPKAALNRQMNREAVNALEGVDLVLFVIEVMRWSELDQSILEMLKNRSLKVLLVINKTDKQKDKQQLLAFMDEISKKYDFLSIIPVSARSKKDVSIIEDEIIQYLPKAPAMFPEDQISNRNQRFFAAEFIREKLMQKLGDEIPYKLAVTIDKFEHKSNCIDIYATIWVEQPGHKKIIIGKEGGMLKAVGSEARIDLEHLFQKKIFLKTWVKIKHKWTEDERAVKQLNLE